MLPLFAVRVALRPSVRETVRDYRVALRPSVRETVRDYRVALRPSVHQDFMWTKILHDWMQIFHWHYFAQLKYSGEVMHVKTIFP